MSSYLSHKRKGFQGTAPAAFNGFGNRSRSFDGVDDYIDLGDSDDFSFGDGSNDSAFSISAWVKLDSVTGTNKSLVGKYTSAGVNDEYLLFYNVNNGEFRFSLYDSSAFAFIRIRSSLTIAADTWYHICVTYDGSQTKTGLKMYVDGSLQTGVNDSNNAYVAMENGISPLTLGAYNTSNYLEGNLADFRFYDTDLTATDISDIYNGINITTNLVGHGLIDADNVLDAVGTSHGTNYGTKYSYDNPSPPVEFGSASRLFDGTSDRVTIPANVFNGATALTVSAWIKLDSIDINQTVIGILPLSNTNAFRLMVRDTNQIDLIWGDGSNFFVSTLDGATLTSGSWIHVAGTFNNSGNATRYVDGAQTGTIDDLSSYGSLSILGDVGIGARVQPTNPLYNLPLDGKIADVRIYDAELTASQISDLYAGTDVTANLVAHYLTDNDDVEDKAGANDGTNFGSTYSYDNPPMDLIPSRQASRSFDGVNNRIDLADQTSTIGTAFSITVWAKLETLDTADGECIVDMADSAVGFQSYIARIFYYGVAGDLEFAVRDAAGNRNVVAISGFSETGWVHLAFVRNGSTVEGYVNGVSVGTDSSSTIGAHTASHYFTIGALRNAGATQGIYNTSGKICDVRLYDNVLTSTDITNIYNGTTDRTNLVGQWLTNSDDVLDHAGTNDGTNNGTTYSTDSPS